MKFRRLIIVIITFTTVALIGNFMEFGGRKNRISQNYPAVACPDVGAGTTMQISLTDKKKLIRKISGKQVKLYSAKTKRVISNSGSILVEGEGINSLAWISKSGIWAGGVICLAPQERQYFVGASADIASKSQLVLVNSGLSNSTVEVRVFSENSSFKKSITVSKNKTFKQSLVSLAPGSKVVALSITPKTGRISSFLLDERTKGLQTLGGDLVNSQSELARTIYIPAIPHTYESQKSHTLRVLNPNNISTNITVELISSDGRYVPIGLDNRKVNADRAVDFSFDFESKKKIFALKVTSDQPIAASVYSQVKVKGKTDFLWSTPVVPETTGTWAITGLEPLFVISGKDIRVSIILILSNGKKISKIINGTDIATYKLPTDAVGLRIESIAKGSAAALIVNSQSGTGYLPLIRGSLLTRSTVPTANIGVLNP